MLVRYALSVPCLLLAFCLPSMQAAAQGDTCTTALQVVSGVHLADGPDSGHGGPAQCGGGQNGDWYAYVPSFTGTIRITSCHPLNNNLDDDTYLKVFTGQCDALACLGYNDDMGEETCPGYYFASFMEVQVTAGATYYIVWTDMFDQDAFYWELSECAGTVTGETYYDNNDNGTREPGEAHAPVMLLIEPGGHYAYAGNDPYSFCSEMGAHTITVPAPPQYHTAVPASVSYDITAMGQQVTDADFGFQGIPGIYDGSCDIWGWNPWIGNETQLHAHYANIGTEDITATAVLGIDAQLSFVSASVTPTSVSGQTVSWDLGVLSPGTSGTITVTIYTPPTVPPNAAVTNTVTLQTVETDIDLANNSDALTGHATTSFDPNDKQVSAVTITPEDVLEQKRLEYTVRFQNTGTAPAVNIVIKDSLDGDWDLSTFEMIGASHPFTLTVDNEVAIWTFANIMLPTEESDAAGSQGSFHYRMAPKSSLLAGDQLTNRADIYFDYNVPVLTNTTVTTVELPTGIAEAGLGHGLSVHPSPGNGLVTVRWTNASPDDAHFTVLDALGRTVYTVNVNGAGANSRSMDLSFLPEGSYVARLSSTKHEAWTRFVVQR